MVRPYQIDTLVFGFVFGKKKKKERASEIFIFVHFLFHNLTERANAFYILLQSESLVMRAIFFFTYKIFIDWQLLQNYANCFIHFSLMSNFLELFNNVFVLSFWHFSVGISCYSDKMEHCLLMVWCGSTLLFFILSKFCWWSECIMFLLLFRFSFQTSERIRRPRNQFGVLMSTSCGDICWLVVIWYILWLSHAAEKYGGFGSCV